MKLREPSQAQHRESLVQRLATLEEKLFAALERIATLEEENTYLRQENAQLREENERLKHELAAARKDSSTSSKPPSSDIVKPPKPPRKDGQKRQRGGQPGHEQHLRCEFPPAAIDHVVPYTLDCCPDCGGKLRLFERPADVLQQVEITATPTIVTEHQALA